MRSGVSDVLRSSIDSQSREAVQRAVIGFVLIDADASSALLDMGMIDALFPRLFLRRPPSYWTVGDQGTSPPPYCLAGLFQQIALLAFVVNFASALKSLLFKGSIMPSSQLLTLS